MSFYVTRCRREGINVTRRRDVRWGTRRQPWRFEWGWRRRCDWCHDLSRCDGRQQFRSVIFQKFHDFLFLKMRVFISGQDLAFKVDRLQELKLLPWWKSCWGVQWQTVERTEQRVRQIRDKIRQILLRQEPRLHSRKHPVYEQIRITFYMNKHNFFSHMPVELRIMSYSDL